jgi:hypothetical protein
MEKKRRSWGEKERERRDVDFFTYGEEEEEEEEKGLSVMKLEILDFLLERFTDGFTGG